MQYKGEEKSVAAIGSMTAAIKAQRVLTASGIAAEIISLSPNETRRGCAYGIEYAMALDTNVRSALRAARISVSQYFRKGG